MLPLSAVVQVLPISNDRFLSVVIAGRRIVSIGIDAGCAVLGNDGASIAVDVCVGGVGCLVGCTPPSWVHKSLPFTCLAVSSSGGSLSVPAPSQDPQTSPQLREEKGKERGKGASQVRWPCWTQPPPPCGVAGRLPPPEPHPAYPTQARPTLSPTLYPAAQSPIWTRPLDPVAVAGQARFL